MKEIHSKIDEDYNHRILHLIADIKNDTEAFEKALEEKCKKVYESVDNWRKTVKKRDEQ